MEAASGALWWGLLTWWASGRTSSGPATPLITSPDRRVAYRQRPGDETVSPVFSPGKLSRTARCGNRECLGKEPLLGISAGERGPHRVEGSRRSDARDQHSGRFGRALAEHDVIAWRGPVSGHPIAPMGARPFFVGHECVSGLPSSTLPTLPSSDSFFVVGDRSRHVHGWCHQGSAEAAVPCQRKADAGDTPAFVDTLDNKSARTREATGDALMQRGAMTAQMGVDPKAAVCCPLVPSG